ncbi:MAG TPA: cation:proton antiporter regulatory subunit [Solirubrobacterales bacterium]
MPDVDETRLPGVGIRHDFLTEEGRRIGVISHFTGRRSLLLYDSHDPDSCRDTVELSEDDLRTLADLLGASHVTEHLANLRQNLKGLAIDWLPVEGDSPFAGRPLGATELRTRTGVSIVALIRGEETIPSPTPDTTIEAGDTAVVVGTPEGIGDALALLRGE